MSKATSGLCASAPNNDAKLVQLTKSLSGLLKAKVTSESLKELGKSLELSQEERVKNNGHVFELTDTIQQEFNVSRFYVSGSYGRRVTVCRPEIDLVVFLKSHSEPPYDDLLFKLHRFLKPLAANKTKMRLLPLTTMQPTSYYTPFIGVEIGNTLIKVYFAPDLGRSSEDQRQAGYKKMQVVFSQGGLKALSSWHPCLIERPSEKMAHCEENIRALIRVCQYWVMQNNILSLEKYAVETLAYLVGKQMLKAESDVNLMKGMDKFLEYCSDLSQVFSLSEIESPATYTSPWSTSTQPILTDNFNPYNNLLGSLSCEDQRALVRAAKAARLKLLQCTSEAVGENFTAASDLTLQNLFIASSKKKLSFAVLFGKCLLFFVGFMVVVLALLLAVAWPELHELAVPRNMVELKVLMNRTLLTVLQERLIMCENKVRPTLVKYFRALPSTPRYYDWFWLSDMMT